ncbi:restriction endonuclease FokI C-terminal domain-containing protein [Peribacillus frigoritolerans]
MENKLLSIVEAAKLLTLSQVSLLKLAKKKNITIIKVGNTSMIEKSDLVRLGNLEVTADNMPKSTESKVIDYWMIPRSVRKWTGLSQMIRSDFKNEIIGSKWKGDRSNHLKRDEHLQNDGLRGKSIGGFVDSSPGGARTDVALIAALGLYYFDENGCIQLTYQGEKMLTATDPASVLTEQLFQFRFPSPYSASIKMDEEIEIFPYRFLFNLLMSEELVDDGSILEDDGVIRITQKELAEFVIPMAKKDSDLDKVVQLIVNHRKSGIALSPSELYNNIANTFINNIEISSFIERAKGSFWLKSDLEVIEEVEERLNKKPRTFKYELGREIEFQQRLGMDPSKSKFTHSQSSNRKSGEFALKFKLAEELQNNPMTAEMIDKKFIALLAKSTGTTEETANKVVNEILKKEPSDYFSEQYLIYSKSGRTFARDFEKTTTKIFMELLGQDKARWTGKEGKSPDVVIEILNLNGLIDCKAESRYSIPNDHFNRISVEESGYIPSYKAKFFIYVAESFGKSFEKNLRRIETKTGAKGCGITAEDLLYLLEFHRKNHLSQESLYNLFTSSMVITKANINELNSSDS